MPRIDARFRISIRNWSKYQREMRGGGKRNRPRLWIALNTDICRDPEIIGLNMEQRWLWVALLTHAGRVGVEFEVSARTARVLFAMRPGWRAQKDLMRLQEHGFIELTVLTEGEVDGAAIDEVSQVMSKQNFPDYHGVRGPNTGHSHYRVIRCVAGALPTQVSEAQPPDRMHNEVCDEGRLEDI